jgi:hypothetical protein
MNTTIQNVFRIASVFSILIISTCVYSQSSYIVKHLQAGERSGSFMFIAAGDTPPPGKTEVTDISIDFTQGKSVTMIFSAEIIEEVMPEVNSNSSASIKSWADPEYERKITYEADGEDGVYSKVEDDIKEDEIPYKTYAEFIIDGNTLEYSFFDKSGLESIVSQVNSSYGTSFQVTGSGRNVSVGTAAPVKKLVERSVSARIEITPKDYEDGVQLQKVGFDPNDLFAELLKDKILQKKALSSFKLSLDSDYIYINGSRIQDKILGKYRKLLGDLFFEFRE